MKGFYEFNIPKQVTLGSYEVSVIIVPEVNEAGAFGEFNSKDMEIRIKYDLNKQQQAICFVHEVLHACAALAEMEEGVKLTEEEFVSRIAPWLAEYILNNL